MNRLFAVLKITRLEEYGRIKRSLTMSTNLVNAWNILKNGQFISKKLKISVG